MNIFLHPAFSHSPKHYWNQTTDMVGGVVEMAQQLKAIDALEDDQS